MSRAFLIRLVLDGLAASLLVFCLSYWWLGNGAHEAAGTAMFVLLAAHIIFNRRWWAGVTKMRPEPKSILNVVLTFALLLAMIGLLATSALISHTLAELWPVGAGFTLKQIHAAIGWWVLILAAVHVVVPLAAADGDRRPIAGIEREERSEDTGSTCARRSDCDGRRLECPDTRAHGQAQDAHDVGLVEFRRGHSRLLPALRGCCGPRRRADPTTACCWCASGGVRRLRTERSAHERDTQGLACRVRGGVC